MMKNLSEFTRNLLSAVMLSSTLFSINASAATSVDVTISSSLDGTESTWIDFFGDEESYFDVFPVFTADAGQYDFSIVGDTLDDPTLHLYTAFDSNSPGSNLIVRDDDSGSGLNASFSAALGATSTYFLVASNFDSINGSFATGTYTVNYTGPVAAVPEPETYAMFLAGLGMLGFAARRRKT